MSRMVKGGLIQCANPLNDESRPVAEIQAAAYEAHIPFIEDAGKHGVQILCLQEIFNGPYFCPSQDKRWYAAAESVPGPTLEALTPYARKHNMVIVVPVYEREQAGVQRPEPAQPAQQLPPCRPFSAHAKPRPRPLPPQQQRPARSCQD